MKTYSTVMQRNDISVSGTGNAELTPWQMSHLSLLSIFIF